MPSKLCMKKLALQS